MSLGDTWSALKMALAGVPGLTVYTDPGANIDPPGAVVGLPDLSGEVYNSPLPNEIQLSLYLIVKSDDTSEDRLVSLLDTVAEKLDESTDFVIRAAQPGIYQTGGTDLPCYVVAVEGNTN
jgi:hypothetical protein